MRTREKKEWTIHDYIDQSKPLRTHRDKKKESSN